MKCKILENSGFCYGVKNALNIAVDTKKKYPNNNVYILGMLVHNEKVISELTKNNIITIDVLSKDYSVALSNLKEGDVVIFSAHGHDEKLDQICKRKNIICIDAICPMVKHCQTLIKNALSKKEKVIYIGITNHSETNAMLSIDKDIIFLDYKLPINYQFNTKDKYYCINQTTLNYLTLHDLHNELRHKIPHLEIANEICDFTKKRQQAILNIPADVDGIIIVGSNRSSNSTRLYELSKMTYPNKKVYFINDKNQLNIDEIKKLSNIIICGGTSTDIRQLEEIRKFILTL